MGNACNSSAAAVVGGEVEIFHVPEAQVSIHTRTVKRTVGLGRWGVGRGSWRSARGAHGAPRLRSVGDGGACGDLDRVTLGKERVLSFPGPPREVDRARPQALLRSPEPRALRIFAHGHGGSVLGSAVPSVERGTPLDRLHRRHRSLNKGASSDPSLERPSSSKRPS